MPESHAPYGKFGYLPPDILLIILAHVDVHTVLAAERVSSAWRSLVHDGSSLWRSLFLQLEDIDATTKWRLLALDGRPGPFRPRPSQDMPEGDGRGVSGPPIDTATRCELPEKTTMLTADAMALRGRWADEFRRDVVDKLADNDPIRAGIFDDNGDVKEIELPLATDLVYQWGTRLDRPDWRKECKQCSALSCLPKRHTTCEDPRQPRCLPRGIDLHCTSAHSVWVSLSAASWRGPW